MLALTSPPFGNEGADSQHSLARAIADEALSELPDASSSREEVERVVDEAIRRESRRMERVLAELRLAALLAGLGYVAIIVASGGPAPRHATPMAWTFAAWTIPAATLLLALHRGAYRRWMRIAVPLADALLVGSVFTALAGTGVPAPPALVGAGGAAAALLAFLGPTRLSRSGGIVAPLGACALWTYVGVRGGLPVEAIVGVAGVVLAGAHLGAHLTRGVRSLISEQARGVSLARLYDGAQHALDAREQVLAIVCHDLRTPLTTISATAGLLMDIPVDDEGRLRHLRVIQRASRHMDRLVHDLLDVSRIEAGTLVVSPEPRAVDEILRRAGEIMRPVTEEKEIELVVTAPPEGAVYADPVRIHQVLCNLVGNATKFSRAGSRIVLEARPMGPKVRISVRDQGPGIAEADLGHLFKRLWQAAPGDRRGLGLGLSIAKSIVEAHGERIGVSSEVGVGSEFWFTLARSTSPPLSTRTDSWS